MDIFMNNKIIILLLVLSSIASAEWSEPIRISAPGGYATPMIIAMGDTIHVVAEDFNVTDKICYLRSTDGGLNWSNQRVLSDDSCQTLFPKLIESEQRLIALWKNEFDYGGGPHNIGYRISTNGGQSWGQVRYVLNPGRVFPFYFSASCTDSIINIVACGSPADSMVFYSLRSTNFGQTWSQPSEIFRASETEIPAQISFDSQVHFVWVGLFDENEQWETYYAKSTDYGQSWSNNIRLSTRDLHPSNSPEICANESGLITVSWMDYKYSPYMITGDILLRQSADSGLTWGPERQATFNHCALKPITVSHGDTIHLVWEDLSSGLGHENIFYVYSTDNGISWSNAFWVDGTLDDSWNPSICVSNRKIYTIWADARFEADSSQGGLYFSQWNPDPDAIHGSEFQAPIKLKLTAYPNPFNSSISINYSIFDENGIIKIYDIQGRLLNSFYIKGGEYGKIIWDATDAMGNKVSSGIYFAKAEASQESSIVKLLYLK
jgi:hypothetical protein